ncbi:MAG: potassium transporter TrkG [Pseudomonadota bacterium]|nr:potassium transporter TrkG [Pseudomonadota bacterium]
MAFSVTMLLPLAVAIFAHDAALSAFAPASGIGIAAGAVTWVLTRKCKRELRVRDGILLVALTWTFIPIVASLPLLLHFGSTLSFTDAYFEMASALTTTGATIFTNLDTMPPSLNLWRHLVNWFGGMGIIVLAVAILPLLGVGGMQLFKAETPGPMKDSKLTPRIEQTASVLWLVYAATTAACILSLYCAGMSWFDAICHGFSAMALGGFSTHDASIGYYDSVPIETVLTVFQILAALNFATHYLAWRSRSLRAYRHDPEVKYVLGLLASSCVGIGVYLYLTGTYPDLGQSLRHATFNVVTIATDCGYATQDFAAWPAFAPMWMLFLSCLTVSSGSTGGGVKMIRTMVIARQAANQLKQLVHPRALMPLRIGGRPMPESLPAAVLGFTFLYFISVVTLTFVLLLSGMDFISAFSAIIACINNMGPGLGTVGPAANYASLTDFQSWVCALAMILGRLEIFPLLVLATRAFWRK